MSKEIKKNILANLEDLRDKVNFSKSQPQTVVLNSHYFDDAHGKWYNLSIELIVTMFQPDDENQIDEFFIERVYFTQNNGEDADFKFSINELTEYIDF